jgi:hypothetical protein
MGMKKRFRETLLAGTAVMAMVLGPFTEIASARGVEGGFHSAPVSAPPMRVEQPRFEAPRVESPRVQSAPSRGSFHGGDTGGGGNRGVFHGGGDRGGFHGSAPVRHPPGTVPVRPGRGSGTDPLKGRPVNTGPVKTGPVKTGPVKTGPVKTGPVKTGPVTDPGKGRPPVTGPGRNHPVPVESGKGHLRPPQGQHPTRLHGSPLGHQHLLPPKPPVGGKRSDALWHSGGYGYYWYGRDQHYFGQFYQGPLDWDVVQGAYPFPYLFPDYYPGDWQYSPPCGVWVIQTWLLHLASRLGVCKRDANGRRRLRNHRAIERAKCAL